MKKCQVFVPFKEGILALEELGGINNDFICFNPDRSAGRPDYKIQFTEKMLLKFEGENQLVSIFDYEDEFIIIDSKGDVITDSLNVNPDFVENLIADITENEGAGIPKEDLN